MSQPIISVENLGKRYRIHHEQKEGYTTLRDVLARKVKGLFSSESGIRNPKSSDEDFWALKGVSFEVQPGEVLGIIGRNGAGKSTLLKILSRITESTEGRVTLRGRVASLLEVGTGFHPELTGRENIFLNGAILGMMRSEIRKKFDEIVAFAEVEKFLDTPVKRYSSGMYVRLAFAVAAHLEPEILILDEVLAVGDAQFQKKCIGKMEGIAREGRTILFVSHNTGTLANLCTSAMLLTKGQLTKQGSASEVIDHYISGHRAAVGEVVWNGPETAPGNNRVRLQAVRIRTCADISSDIPIDEDFQLEVDYWNDVEGLPLNVSFHLVDRVGGVVLATANLPSANLVVDPWASRSFPKGLYRSACTIPKNFLNEGQFSVRAAIVSDVHKIEFLTGDVLSFTIHDTGEMRKEYGGGWIGVVRPKLAWQTKKLTI
jgi:lipopolysaccharide transport system ATP-binding protein